MRIALTDRGWHYGSYTRGHLKGDILLGQYSYAGVGAVLSPWLVMAKDEWAEQAREKGWISREQATAYTEKLNQLLSRFVKDMETPYETIHEAVCELRTEAFGPDGVNRIFLHAAGATDACPENMDIDQEEMGREMLRRCRHALFVLEDPTLTSWMRRDMEYARTQGAQVHTVCGNEKNAALPGEEALAAAGFKPDVRFGREAVGEAEGEAALADAAEKGEACLFWYGETGLSTCRRLAVPAMVKCVPRSLVGRALTGQFTETGRCAAYVPAHFDILPWVPMVRPTLASFRQLAWLSAEHGKGVYALTAEEMYRRWPEMFFSVYEEWLPGLPEGVNWPCIKDASPDWYAAFCAEREAAIGALLDQTPGVRRLNGWFDLETMEQKAAPWGAVGEAKGILAHGVLIDRIAGADVIMTEGKTLSPRKLLRDEKEPPKLQFFSNYLFFMTSRLIALYNRLREDRPREQIHFQGGHMDYMLYREDGRRTETFPLYRKGCMGMTEDGQFVFFHFRLRGGECAVNGQTVEWTEDDVDPAKPGAAAVYTPYLSRPDQGASKFEYVKAVGEGRVNFVIHQNDLVCVREGDVLLPGTGAVLSLEKEKGRKLAEACGFQPAENGYYRWGKKPGLTTRLEHPADVPEEVWRRMQWAYGGGLTLARGGECVFQRNGNAAEMLALEGWASPLSAQTQESEIAALVRHPRTAIGLTKEGKLFILVFSGRSSISAGADYVEMCEIARRLVPDLQDMINVDGGASSVLGLGMGRRFIEYSRPSTSFDSLAGMVRPINSVFRVIPAAE